MTTQNNTPFVRKKSAEEQQAITERFNKDDLNDANLNEAQLAIKQAYLMLSFGHFEQAIELCKEATKLCPNNVVPPALYGAILLASGRATEAIQHLSRTIRKYPTEPLPRLYFCEACLLGGRTQRGFKELETLGKTLQEDSPWFPFYEGIKQTFDGLDPKLIPPPLVVPEPSETDNDNNLEQTL